MHITLTSSHVIHIAGGFGFAPGGKATLDLKSFTIQQKEEGEDVKAFFLLRKYKNPDAFLEEYSTALDSNDCLLEDGHEHHEDFLLDVSDPTKWSTEQKLEHTFTEETSGLYYLIFQRCLPSSDDKHHKVSFLLTHHFANYSPTGSEDHLSTGEQPLPTVYLIFGICYAAAGAAWITMVRKAKKSETSAGRGVASRSVTRDIKVHHIHHLMTVLVCVKATTVLADAIKWHYIRSTGSGDAWTVIYYLLAGFKGVALFLVLMLIGSGWSFVKPFLGEKEKKVFFAILVLQVIDNIALLVVQSSTPGTSTYLTWENLFRFIDMCCCAAILFPVVWQIRALEEVVQENDKAERTIEKLTLFRQFYILVVSYIYFTRIIVFLITTTLPYSYAYLSVVMEEGATLVFYTVVGWKFRPKERNPYLMIRSSDSDDEDDDEENGLNMEEFGLEDEDDGVGGVGDDGL